MARCFATLLLTVMMCASPVAAQVKPRVRVGENVMSAQAVTKFAPNYPPLARQARIQGSVVLNVEITHAGDVANIQLISGHPMLAPAAIEAVKQWKYKPFLLNGEPVDVETKVEVSFTLSDHPAASGVVGDSPGGIPPGKIGGIVPGNPDDPTRSGIPQRVRVSAGVTQGLLIRRVNPLYPPEARVQHIEGAVWMKATIDRQGSIANLQLIKGHPLLAPAAIEAVRQWKYRPYQLNGMPVEIETQVQVNFTLAP